jgi:transcriptional regulator with XRE-family HTH domain
MIEFLLNRSDPPRNRNSINGQGMITVRQMKAARALLAWSQADLAEASGVSEPTIARLESDDGELGGRPETGQKLVAALTRAGIEFIGTEADGLGVKMRKLTKRR